MHMVLRAHPRPGDGTNGHADIMAAYSTDLLTWDKDPVPLYRAGGHPLGVHLFIFVYFNNFLNYTHALIHNFIYIIIHAS